MTENILRDQLLAGVGELAGPIAQGSVNVCVANNLSAILETSLKKVLAGRHDEICAVACGRGYLVA